MPKSKATKSKSKSNNAKYKDALLFLAERALIIVVLLLTSVNINSFLASRFSVLGASTEIIYDDPVVLENDRLFWEQVILANPTYRDGYLELADIYAKLGDLKKSEEYRNTARRIDPN